MLVAVMESALLVVSRALVASVVAVVMVAAESDLEDPELLMEPDSVELKVELSVAVFVSRDGTLLITITRTVKLAITTTTSDSNREVSDTRVTKTPPAISATLKAWVDTHLDTDLAPTPMATVTGEITDMVVGPTTSVPGTTELTTTTMVDSLSMTSVMLPTMPTIPLISSKLAESLVATVTSTNSMTHLNVVSSTEVAALLTVLVMPNSAQSLVSADATMVVLFPTVSVLAELSLAHLTVVATKVSLLTTPVTADLTTARREPPSDVTKNKLSTPDGECFD